MIEHIVALKLGTDVDNVLIRLESGDPPLFERGSLDLLEALDSAGRVEQERPVRWFTVKEKVTVGMPGDLAYLTFHPAPAGSHALTTDCAIDFPTFIGKQRIKFPINPEHIRRGAEARTNTPYSKILFCRTIGKLFADIRNLGYTEKNVLIARKNSYYNEPKLIHEGRSLEAVWHTASTASRCVCSTSTASSPKSPEPLRLPTAGTFRRVISNHCNFNATQPFVRAWLDCLRHLFADALRIGGESV
jgi:UDP-3-O-acyl-N-acetylglucosamine deacetylase